jgi:signal transduction histidine kinase
LIGWRPRHPLAYVSCLLAVMMGLAIVSPAVYDVGLVGVLSLVVPTYAIAAWLPARTAAVGFVVWSAGAGVNAVRDHSSVSRFVGGYLMAIVIFALARVVRSQRILSTALAARNLALAERRDDRARAAVASERIRIARDLHVHIAALIGAMVVQATAAKQRVTADLRGALDAAGAVEQDGREVLSQMRRVLGVLRSDREVPLRPVYAEELGPPPLVPA